MSALSAVKSIRMEMSQADYAERTAPLRCRRGIYFSSPRDLRRRAPSRSVRDRRLLFHRLPRMLALTDMDGYASHLRRAQHAEPCCAPETHTRRSRRAICTAEFTEAQQTSSCAFRYGKLVQLSSDVDTWCGRRDHLARPRRTSSNRRWSRCASPRRPGCAGRPRSVHAPQRRAMNGGPNLSNAL